ncbi:MAG: PglL family O-oligosaccharyltransferase [Burkholderiales bacterium]
MPSAQALEPTRSQAEVVSLLLAGSLCLLPFLLPYPQLFQAEWLAAALGVAAALTSLGKRGNRVIALPGPARWLAGFALFLLAQALVGRPAYVQLPLLAALYVAYAALLVWLGAQLAASAGIERAAGVLAACLLVGALANAAAGMIQFYGLPASLRDFIVEMHRDPLHNGAYGNIAQPNLYANYLALGATALLFLWQRASLRTAYALAAAVLLAWACALSGSRAALLFALWFAILGALAGHMQNGNEARRLKFAAYGVACALLAAQLAVPWFNDALHLGPANQGAFERAVELSSAHAEPRWELWRVAWRIFIHAPVAGAGIGEFAGAAFRSGLPPELTQFDGVVWISPHNLVLQLLAETGALGAVLALGGLCTWWWQAGRRYVAAPRPAMWWIIAAVGIETIHSMVEFPLWNAQFLGVTALIAGLGMLPDAGSRTASRATAIAIGATCVALILAMAMVLRDYVRLNATSSIETPLTRAGAAAAAHDAAIMRSLTHGPLAPAAEYWSILGASLDRRELSERLRMSERAMRYYPSDPLIVRRAVFLAFDGQTVAARQLLAQAMRTFPKRCTETIGILTQALNADPRAIEPLLAQTRNGYGKSCM